MRIPFRQEKPRWSGAADSARGRAGAVVAARAKSTAQGRERAGRPLGTSPTADLTQRAFRSGAAADEEQARAKSRSDGGRPASIQVLIATARMLRALVRETLRGEYGASVETKSRRLDATAQPVRLHDPQCRPAAQQRIATGRSAAWWRDDGAGRHASESRTRARDHRSDRAGCDRGGDRAKGGHRDPRSSTGLSRQSLYASAPLRHGRYWQGDDSCRARKRS